MKRVVENEARILLKLGDHRNITLILDHGWLPKPHSYFYIDMELCDSNLHDYIHGVRTLQDDTEPFDDMKFPVYVPRNISLLTKLRNTWTIMSHISDGLKFIHAHSQVHRDLKPRNGNLFGILSVR